ncbi:MAG TPA: hypothetical protein VK279_06770 [Solirubrobacteraceae bacterium]|nr:hypothetical protein [Solirubrobacteraceae bacterium]
MKTDPTDTGGLFVSRRPGTRPVKYRGVPERAGARRRRIDNALAALVLALEVLIALSFWGPLPVAWLWVASQVQYVTDRVEAGLVAGFAGLMASLILGLMIMRRLDHLWVLMRRAAGHDQRTGRIGIVFGVTCAVGAACFAIWLILIQGPGSSIAPR